MESQLNIATPIPAYSRLAELWKIPELLMQGTQAMRDQHVFTLPIEPREPPEAYARRWKGATLFNAYKRTVRTLSSKPFSRPLNIEGLPPALEYMRKDADHLSTPLERVVQLAIQDRINYGKALLMVRMPFIEAGTSETERRNNKMQPYLSRVPASSLIGWSYNEEDGSLANIRLHFIEDVTETDEQSGHPVHVREQEVVEFWSPYLYEKFVKMKAELSEDVEWVSQGVRTNELGEIPLMVSGRLEDGPMLEDLGYLNLQHFRSRSDQDTILHVARVPLLFFAGWDKDDVETTVSVNNAFVNRSKDAKVQYVEIEGASIEAGNKDLLHIEDQMLVMGADLLTLKPGNPTATAKAIDTSEKISDLQAIVIDLEFDMVRAFEMAASYLNAAIAEDILVTMSKEFGVTIKQREELDILLRSRQTNDISKERFLREVERRGVFADDFDLPAEVKLLEDEDVEQHDKAVELVKASAVDAASEAEE